MQTIRPVRRLITFFLVSCCSILMLAVRTQAQQVTVTGSIVDKDNRLVLPYASVFNKSTGKRAYSDKGGFYKISANPKDLIIFSFIGYKPDSIVVSQAIGTETREIGLVVESKQLRSVEVSSRLTPYQIDSLERREKFGYILDLPNHRLAGDNTPQGAGIVFSPFTRYSRKEKQKREFKKIYAKAEMQKYIDSRFTPLFVSRVTSLKGDSLLHFMQDNYPDYNTIRSLNQEDFIYWVTDKYKAWMKK
ncbi:CarboxypepD_reg-like domain-containing protein [Chitinophaga sp. CF118]|uniref:carboxypeptidase-like regulatory domain-containing protein n=1 Tax=Chitinophaga sp. CF118 TaxID=1884367 RepID=UPI0008DF23B1|nr:carboxypeptidase-like regulatory domain-containing protein [Chitinophaga sp. CF118]SFE13046.1 CarboxypepD_reg-like domain-containing protein [Chitinophaga sp. CF118]